jgi:hypothetical protein
MLGLSDALGDFDALGDVEADGLTDGLTDDDPAAAGTNSTTAQSAETRVSGLPSVVFALICIESMVVGVHAAPSGST